MPYYRVRESSTVPTATIIPGISSFDSTEITVTNEATNLIPSNINRKSLAIINESEFEMLVNQGTETESPASATAKIKIIPPQTEFSWLPNELPLGALNAIWVGAGPTGPGKVVVVEGV